MLDVDTRQDRTRKPDRLIMSRPNCANMVKETFKRTGKDESSSQRAATTIRCKAVLKHISYDEIVKLERPAHVKNDKLSKVNKTDHLLRCKTAKTRKKIDVMIKPSKNQEKPIQSKNDISKSVLPKTDPNKTAGSGCIEFHDLEANDLKKCYCHEMLNQEENALRARVLYERKLLEKAISKERDLHIQQVQHDFTKRRTVDEIKLKLEAVIKRKILLEAIHDTLQREHEKYNEIMKIEVMKAETHQTKQQLMERVHSNIMKQLTDASYSITPKQRPVKELNQNGIKTKTVTIKEDFSVISDSAYSCMSEESSYLSEDICLSCGPTSNYCSCPKKSSSISSSKGIVRTNTFHNIFEEKRYNIGKRNNKRTTSKSVPTLYFNGGLEVIDEDIDLTDGIWDMKRGKVSSVQPDQEHKAEERIYKPNGGAAGLHSTTEKLVSNVLTHASAIVDKSVRKVPRDSLTIKNACKRNSVIY